MRKFYLFTLCFALFSYQAMAQTKRYVKPVATGEGDGSSWANASGNLQDMINASALNDEVWVAAGTYVPTEKIDAGGGVRDVSFILKTGVKIYGSLAVGATDLTNRNFTANASILSGDLGTDGKAYHVVASKNSSNNVILDGFAIQDGLGDATTPLSGIARNQGAAINLTNEETNVLFKNLTIKDNQVSGTGNAGGGVYLNLSNTSNCVLENVTFSGNKSAASGGALYFTSSEGNPTVTISSSKVFSSSGTSGAGLYVLGTSGNVPQFKVLNTIFSENRASNNPGGGAIYVGGYTNSTIVNCTFYNNSNANGALSFNNASNTVLNLYNNLFNKNTRSTSNLTSADIRNITGATLDLRSNLFQAVPIEDTDSEYKNIIEENPSNLFLSTTITDANFLKLVEGAATEKGDNSYITTYGLTTDLAGEVRVKHTNVDLGAYEYQGTLPVELESFTAKKVNTGVQLNWKIASEVNNDRFVIERSADLVSFQELKAIPSKGDTQNTVIYNYTDYSPLNGNNYYRLSQVDKDGTVKILGTEVVNFDVSDIQVSAYPNPATDYIKLKLNNLQNTSINVKLVSLLGQTLIAKRFESAFGKEISLDVRNINAGNYVLSIEALGKTQVVKMAIAR